MEPFVLHIKETLTGSRTSIIRTQENIQGGRGIPKLVIPFWGPNDND